MLKCLEPLFFQSLLILHEPWYLSVPGLAWLHISSHSLIALFYYFISILLIYFLYQRQNLPYTGILVLLGAFTLASGTTNLMKVWVFWHPNSQLAQGIEANTAVMALFVVLMAVLLLPKVLALPIDEGKLAVGNWQLEEGTQEKNILKSARQNSSLFSLPLEPACEHLSTVSNLPSPDSEIQGRVRWLEELGLLQSLYALINDAPDFYSALCLALRLLCEVTHWDYGEAWLPCADNGVLHCSLAWYGKDTALKSFRQEREKLTFPPNIGLPGRVWSSRRPEWIEDISTQPNPDVVHPLTPVAELRAGFAVPILMGDHVLAVLTFFLAQSRAQDQQLVELISAVATQLGLVMQRKQLEEQLRQERDFSKTLIETSSAFFVAVDAKGRTIMMNPAFLNAVGYTLDEVLGTDYLSTFARKSDRKALYKTFKRLIQSKQPILQENYVLTKDGRKLLVEWRGKPIFKPSQAESGNKGELDFFFGVGIDISDRKQLEQELRHSEERYRAVVEDQTELICRFVADGTITFVNDAYCRYFGKTREELLGSSLFQMIPQQYREKTQKQIASLSLTNSVAKREYQFVLPNGDIRWLQWTDRTIVDSEARGRNILLTGRQEDGSREVVKEFPTSPLPPVPASSSSQSSSTQIQQGQIIEFQSVGRDITERRWSEQETARLASIALLSPNPIVETDLEGNVRYLNPEAMRVLPDLQELGANHPFLAGVASMTKVLQQRGSLQREVKIDQVYYEQVLHYLEEIQCFRIYAFDISDRKQAEKQLIHNAFYDQLTGLANRALFMDRLRQAFRRAKQSRRINLRGQPYLFAVLFLNLNRFKLVNDSLGNPSGDQLLQSFAQRLQSCLRSTDTVARLGGDEFAILLEGIQGVNDAVQVAESINETLSSSFYLNESEVFMTLSIGIALNTDSDDQPEDLLRNADLAMYRARSKGASYYEVFDAAMHEFAVDRLQIETDLRRAIERQEFRVHYQPIVSLLTNKINGFEALLRWEHPLRGLVSPTEFIPTAEETGLITPIGWWTLQEACRQLKVWQEQFPAEQPLTMNVNLSCKQFTQPDLLEQIDRILQETQLAVGSLKLEITESVVMDNPDLVKDILLELTKRKIPLCIDDFGTGYSSLSRLHNFPISTLKIDRSFVSRIGAMGENSEIIQAIVTLAQTLSMDVVAEGIEVSEQVLPLIALRCEYGQGYFFSKPLDSEGAKALLIAEWQQRNKVLGNDN
ncbi:MAG: EAL domain-containing protein [Cyanobacteriota bacterium]